MDIVEESGDKIKAETPIAGTLLASFHPESALFRPRTENFRGRLWSREARDQSSSFLVRRT